MSRHSVFHFDTSTLFRQFKKHIGMSPKAYIEQTRMKRAADLLQHSTLSIGEIARNVPMMMLITFTVPLKKTTAYAYNSGEKNPAAQSCR